MFTTPLFSPDINSSPLIQVPKHAEETGVVTLTSGYRLTTADCCQFPLSISCLSSPCSCCLARLQPMHSTCGYAKAAIHREPAGNVTRSTGSAGLPPAVVEPVMPEPERPEIDCQAAYDMRHRLTGLFLFQVLTYVYMTPMSITRETSVANKIRRLITASGIDIMQTPNSLRLV